MSDKKALERLKTAVAKNTPGNAVIIERSDLSWLIAEQEGLEREVESLRLAMLGGEDAPGYAMSLTLDEVLQSHREYATSQRDRAESAESRLSALSEALASAVKEVEGARTNDAMCFAMDGLLIAARRALLHPAVPVETTPLKMLLLCPKCGVQHVDAPEYVAPSMNDPGSILWENPPHRSHLCHACGCIWRPADVPTEGVATIETKGSVDNWPDPTQGWAISSDGPHPITEQRRWLARQLLDSKLDDGEAFGIVTHHPDLTDIWKPKVQPHPDVTGLVEALEPFAEAAGHLHPSQPDSGVTLDGIEVGQWRKAASALAAFQSHQDERP